MKKKKGFILGIVILLILAIALSVTLVVVWGWNNILLRLSTAKFYRLIKQGIFDDLSLTIYYRIPDFLTLAPLAMEDLTDPGRANVTFISGSDLVDFSYSLKALSKTELIPIKQNSMLDARLYYIFNYNNNKVFDVAMWSCDYPYYVIVNGIAVEENEYLYDFVRQFLPEDAARQLDIHIGRNE